MNALKVSRNGNDWLSTVDKFKNLRSYLGGSTLNSIEVLEDSERNRDISLNIIENIENSTHNNKSWH